MHSDGAGHTHLGIHRAPASTLGASQSKPGARYRLEAVDDAATAVADVQEQVNDLVLLVVELAERVDGLARHP